MSCCPFLSGTQGHPPYLLWLFIVFSIVGLVIIIQKLNKVIKFIEKK